MADIFVKGAGGGVFKVDSTDEHVRHRLERGELFRVQASDVVDETSTRETRGGKTKAKYVRHTAPDTPTPGAEAVAADLDALEALDGLTKQDLLDDFSPDGVTMSSTRDEIVDAVVAQGLV